MEVGREDAIFAIADRSWEQADGQERLSKSIPNVWSTELR
jgi:hypothetical protein